MEMLPAQKNRIGLTLADYRGQASTLCGGCGHDSITGAIVKACFELALPPYMLAKLSGIGCSSKTPAYFVSSAHGLNGVHGRMPPLATGANLAQRSMTYLAVSGDGDTGSIGLSHFIHAMRRQVNMLYLVENNGVYGLTKGQFSATADKGARSKKGQPNPFVSIDLVRLAIEMGAAMVARSFAGDKQQLVPLIKMALATPGFCLIDVLSPCVTFNNHSQSSRSYAAIRQSQVANYLVSDFVPAAAEIQVDSTPDRYQVELHDKSIVYFKKTPQSHDPQDPKQALNFLDQCAETSRIATGFIYFNPHSKELHHYENTCDKPLAALDLGELRPQLSELPAINQAFS